MISALEQKVTGRVAIGSQETSPTIQLGMGSLRKKDVSARSPSKKHRNSSSHQPYGQSRSQRWREPRDIKILAGFLAFVLME